MINASPPEREKVPSRSAFEYVLVPTRRLVFVDPPMMTVEVPCVELSKMKPADAVELLPSKTSRVEVVRKTVF